ncbi:MAG: hypothetical protein J0H00_13710 [Burkholderiales bacterium]|nr:hypothetical protein [Burkholderiales bacterium]
MRIDIDDGGAGTHGWQVRFRKPSRFFSDSYVDAAGRRRLGSPKASLARATEYLLSIYKPRPRRLPREHRDKQQCTGMAGVRVVWRRHRNRRNAECVVRVDRPDGRPLRVLYVGTETTYSEARLHRMLREVRG